MTLTNAIGTDFKDLTSSNSAGDLSPFEQPMKSDFSSRFAKVAERQAKPPETNTEYAKRLAGQYGARAAELFYGYPGNLKKAFQSVLGTFDEVLPEGLPKFKDIQQLGEKAIGKPEEGSFEHHLYNPPTSGEIQEKITPKVAKKFAGESDYFDPKSEVEKKIGETEQRFLSFFMPGTRQLSMASRIGAPIAGTLAKEGVQYLTGDEKKAEKVSNGVMLMATLAGQSRPGEFASQRIGQAKNMVPENATIDVGNLATRFMPLYNRIQRGLNVPSKSQVRQGMQDLANQVQNGRMSLRSLMDARDNVNEWIAEAGGWDVPGPVRDQTLRNLNEFKTQVIRTIDENLAQRFPEARELYNTGYQASAVVHRSNAISNFIEKYFGKKVASVGAKVLFPSLGVGSAVLPKTAALGAAAMPIYKFGQVLYRVSQSPTLAHYYQQVLAESALGNVPAMVNSMQKLDKHMEIEEKKDRKKKPVSLEEFRYNIKKKG